MRGKKPTNPNARQLRRTRFEKVASRRTQRILNSLDSLANCSNKLVYEFSEEDVRKIFTAIKEKTKTAETIFENSFKKNTKSTFNL